MARCHLLLVLLATAVLIPPALAQQQEDITEAATPVTQSGIEGASKLTGLVERIRAFGVIILLIILVASAVYVSLTGNSRTALMLAGGALVLFGGFWFITVITTSFWDNSGASKEDEIITKTLAISDNLTESQDGLMGQQRNASKVVGDVASQGINILTTLIAPFVIIYGAVLASSIATGDAEPTVFKNYVMGFIVAVSASIIAQIFKTPIIG